MQSSESVLDAIEVIITNRIKRTSVVAEGASERTRRKQRIRANEAGEILGIIRRMRKADEQDV